LREESRKLVSPTRVGSALVLAHAVAGVLGRVTVVDHGLDLAAQCGVETLHDPHRVAAGVDGTHAGLLLGVGALDAGREFVEPGWIDVAELLGDGGE